MDAGGVVHEQISGDGIVLSVFDGDARPAFGDEVAHDFRLVAVSAPYSVGALLDHIALYGIPGKRDFHAVGGGITEVISINQVVVAPTLAGVHSGLSGPQEQSVAGMCDGVEGDEVVAALFIEQDTCRVLSAFVEPVGVAAHVPVEEIVHDLVPAAAVHAYSESGVIVEVIVVHNSFGAARHEQCVLASGSLAALYGGTGAVFQVNSGAVTQPFVLFVLVIAQPV